jgi:hypothetical protein
MCVWEGGRAGVNHTVRLLVVKMVCTSGFLQCPRFFGNTTVHSDPAVLELTRLPLLLCAPCCAGPRRMRGSVRAAV